MQSTSADLFSGLSIVVLYLVIGAAITLISILRARRNGSTTLALDVTRNASFAFVGLTVIGIVMSGLTILGNHWVSLSEPVQDWIAGSRDMLSSPACIDGTWPTGIDPDSAGPTFLCGGSVENVPFGPRLVIYLGTVLGILAAGAIAWAIYTATRRAGMREPFHPSVSRTFGGVSIIVMVTAVLGEVVSAIGMTLAARSLDWSGVEVPFLFSIPWWPFAVAVGMFAMSAIFRYGAQLQRETEGLV